MSKLPESFAASLIESSKYCPGVAFLEVVALISDWLSIYRDTFLPSVSDVVRISQSASSAPTASAS